MRANVFNYSYSYSGNGIAHYLDFGITPQYTTALGEPAKAYFFAGPGFTSQSGPLSHSASFWEGLGLKMGWAHWPYVYVEFSEQQNILGAMATGSGAIQNIGLFAVGAGIHFGLSRKVGKLQGEINALRARIETLERAMRERYGRPGEAPNTRRGGGVPQNDETTPGGNLNLPSPERNLPWQ